MVSGLCQRLSQVTRPQVTPSAGQENPGPRSETAVFAELFQEKSRGPGSQATLGTFLLHLRCPDGLTQEVPSEALWMRRSPMRLCGCWVQTHLQEDKEVKWISESPEIHPLALDILEGGENMHTHGKSWCESAGLQQQKLHSGVGA